jgi:hypothetical protein
MSDKEPMFPIMGDTMIKALPWSVLRPHEAQAKKNHGGQSLERLAHRGGLGIEEAYCVLKDMDFPTGGRFNRDLVRVALMKFVFASRGAPT